MLACRLSVLLHLLEEGAGDRVDLFVIGGVGVADAVVEPCVGEGQ